MIRFLTSGESHGKANIAILEGIPAGLKIKPYDIQEDLNKRKTGTGRGGRGAIEKDKIEIISGIRFGKTIGSPIALLVKNLDHKNWDAEMSLDIQKEKNSKTITRPRPGHADLAGSQKYLHSDIRNVLERSSARETVMRVAIGAICRQFLKEFEIEVSSRVVMIGGVNLKSLFFENQINSMIKKIILQKDTLGGVIEVSAVNVPVGLGSFIQWDKRLDGQIAQSLMSIPSVKAVEIGEGIKSAGILGSKVHDQIIHKNNMFKRSTNNAGGIEGGISNGEKIYCRVFFKPLPTLNKPLETVDIISKSKAKAHIERSDICVIPRAGVICEAMLSFVLANSFLEKFGGDNIKETKRNYIGFIKNL